MSHFAKEHVTRVFKDAGYDLLEMHGDRGGIVQGDGLHLVVTPDIAAAARRYSNDPAVIAGIEKDASNSVQLRIKLYGGSASADLEGVWLPAEFSSFLEEECSGIYYRAQDDVNAIFDAEDAPDREWDGRAYVGVVDEFAMEIIQDVHRVFVRVSRVADQSFNAYESGDGEADRHDAASIIEGSSSHGTVRVDTFEIDADDFIDGSEVFHPFSPEAYHGINFETGMAERVITVPGLIWPRDSNDAYTLELAAELVSEEDEPEVAAALLARAYERGLPRDPEAASSAPRP